MPQVTGNMKELAYTQGFNAYPKTPRDGNPYKGDDKRLEKAWDNGWRHAMDIPTSLIEIGF